MDDAPLRSLPAVHRLLDRPGLQPLIASKGRAGVASAIRRALVHARDALRSGGMPDVTEEGIERHAITLLSGDRAGIRPVLNATGILIHTGLGRSPLGAAAIEAVRRVAAGYCNLEFDLASNERGERASGVAALLRDLTGAEDAAVVNNNAAATVLTLRALAAGREVIVSRGQLVEIGGSFRLPEIFATSGAILREVGTTNRTRLEDYERAICERTAALLRVHPSNYRVVGFTESVEIGPLADLGRRRGLFTIDDIGSGALRAGFPPGVRGEPTVSEGLGAGADVVLFSGDKLLGGPQCGIIAGRKEAVRRIASDPLMRAVRVDKMTLAALEATLGLLNDEATVATTIPLWRSLTTPASMLHARAAAIADRVTHETRMIASAVASESYLGGGSTPVEAIPSAAVRLAPPWPDSVSTEADLARRLRLGDPPVVPRIRDGAVWLDLRAIDPADDPSLAEAILRAVASPRP